MSTLNDTPLVSVIVPVYNVEQYIDDCLNSIRQQSYSNLEIIIVEDCSTDNSNAAIKTHLEDKRVKVIHHEVNSGLSAARNTGIDAATGEFIMFVDSDDLIDSNLVQLCVQSAVESKAEVVLFHEKPFNDGTDISRLDKPYSNKAHFKFVKPEDYFKYQHFAWLKFIKADLIHNNSLKFPVGYYYEDWPFHWELGFIAPSMVEIDNGVYHYRQRKNSITASKDLKLIHTFSSDRLVIEIAERYSASIAVKATLSKKIYDGIWYVIIMIDNEHLKEAVIAANEHLHATREYHSSTYLLLKHKILISALRLPAPLATKAIFSLRLGVNKLSKARKLNK